ncbi:MAG: methyltransferase [Coprococcus sp.]|nr:methyltransferase [Coprococcus sp.]
MPKKALYARLFYIIIGNPPWVNNSTLSSLASDNLPEKKNFKGAKGLDALTGESNFDICEYIILQLIHTFKGTDTTIAMLCKTSVARNIFKELKREATSFLYCDIITFDASRVFGISASACLLLIKLSSTDVFPSTCNLYSLDTPKTIYSTMGFRNSQFYSDLTFNADNFDGICCFEWRQGVKHDCSKVMELSSDGNSLKNGQGETVSIEDDVIFPLIKSSMFKAPIITVFTKYVIVTQKRVREETLHIQQDFPKAWTYLNNNIIYFNKRKSSIYRNSPVFSMFGIGDYSYSKYKVGVSGFYKKPMFSVLSSPDGKPVMTDDTSYFICFDSYDMAYVAMLILNSERVQKFLKSIVFLDSKRPYTKKVLSRLDFSKICKVLTYSDLKSTEYTLDLSDYLTPEMFDSFIDIPQIQQQRII